MIHFLLVPAQVASPGAPQVPASAPRPEKALHEVLEALEGVPETLTDHKASHLPAAKVTAVNGWNRHRLELEAILNAADREALNRAMERVASSEGSKAGDAAIDASELLSTLLPDGRSKRLDAVDRACARAWMKADQGAWSAIPDLEAAFATFLKEGKPSHAKTVTQVQILLKNLATSKATLDTKGAKGAIEGLLESVDSFEK